MKKIILLALVMLSSNTFGVGKKSNVLIGAPTVEEMKVSEIVVPKEKSSYQIQLDSLTNWGFNFFDYERRLAKRESSNIVNAVNSIGSLGLYQFRPSTLRLLIKKGYIDDSFLDHNRFLNSRWMQRKALIALCYSNMITSKRMGLFRYHFKEVGGVLVTPEGVLAAMHLRGPRGAKRYLKTGGSVDLTDGYGTPVSQYFRLMSDLKYINGHNKVKSNT